MLPESRNKSGYLFYRLNSISYSLRCCFYLFSADSSSCALSSICCNTTQSSTSRCSSQPTAEKTLHGGGARWDGQRPAWIPGETNLTPRSYTLVFTFSSYSTSTASLCFLLCRNFHQSAAHLKSLTLTQKLCLGFIYLSSSVSCTVVEISWSASRCCCWIYSIYLHFSTGNMKFQKNITILFLMSFKCLSKWTGEKCQCTDTLVVSYNLHWQTFFTMLREEYHYRWKCQDRV